MNHIDLEIRGEKLRLNFSDIDEVEKAYEGRLWVLMKNGDDHLIYFSTPEKRDAELARIRDGLKEKGNP